MNYFIYKTPTNEKFFDNPFRRKPSVSPEVLAMEKFCKQFGELPCSKDGIIGVLFVRYGLRDWYMYTDPTLGQSDMLLDMERRIHEYGLVRMESRTLMLLVQLSVNPASVVMYLAYIQYWCKLTNTRYVDLKTFTRLIFPTGVPSEDALKTIWYSQKVYIEGSSDNMLDNKKAYQAILV